VALLNWGGVSEKQLISRVHKTTFIFISRNIFIIARVTEFRWAKKKQL
jgi:hypothetical protein